MVVTYENAVTDVERSPVIRIASAPMSPEEIADTERYLDSIGPETLEATGNNEQMSANNNTDSIATGSGFSRNPDESELESWSLGGSLTNVKKPSIGGVVSSLQEYLKSQTNDNVLLIGGYDPNQQDDSTMGIYTLICW